MRRVIAHWPLRHLEVFASPLVLRLWLWPLRNESGFDARRYAALLAHELRGRTVLAAKLGRNFLHPLRPISLRSRKMVANFVHALLLGVADELRRSAKLSMARASTAFFCWCVRVNAITTLRSSANCVCNARSAATELIEIEV